MIEEITANIMCPSCGAFGVIVWEFDAGKRSSISISESFSERIPAKRSSLIELRCNACGAIQLDDQIESS
jgi:hypothetical protein